TRSKRDWSSDVCSSDLRGIDMAAFIGAFPVLPGKDDDVRKFAQEPMGRSEEFSASQKRGGVTKEEWSLQQSPMGSLVLVHFEARSEERREGKRVDLGVR